jgi:hypothetical protein
MNASIQANVDALGHDTAFSALKGYIGHNAKWCVSSAPAIIKKEPCGIDGLLSLLNFYLYMPHRGQNRFKATEDGAIRFDVIGCRQNGAYPNQCEWFCELEIPMMCKESNPGLVMKFESSLLKGDDHCSWIIRRLDRQPISDEVTDYQILDTAGFDTLTVDMMACGGPGEFLSMATSNLLDCLDYEKALVLLKRNAKKAGEEFGAYLLRKRQGKVDDPVEALQIVDSLMQIEGEFLNEEPSVFQKRVEACPFTDSTPEVCMQIVAFKEGMLSVVSPKLSLEYHIKSNPCFLRLKKNQIIDQDVPVKIDRVSNDPLAVLTLRFARGEITEDELEKKIAHLKKLGLVK